MKSGMFLCLLGALPAWAGLKFDEPLQTVEAGADSNQVVVDFTFKNDGTTPASIVKYEAGCTCAEALVKDGKLHYAPGESGLIRATFDMSNFSGTVDKPIQIWLQGDPADKPSVVLTARIKIPVLVEIEPKTLTWDVDGPAEAKTITLTMNHSEPIHITDISNSSENFSHTLETVEDGKRYQLTITPKDTSQMGIAIFHLQTDCEIPRHRTQRVFSVVRKPAAVVATPAP